MFLELLFGLNHETQLFLKLEFLNLSHISLIFESTIFLTSPDALTVPIPVWAEAKVCSWVWPWVRWFHSTADTLLTAEIKDFTSFLLLSVLYATHWHYWFNTGTVAFIGDISSVILLGSFIFIINIDEVIQELKTEQHCLSTSFLIGFSTSFLHVHVTMHIFIIWKFKYPEGRGQLHIWVK